MNATEIRVKELFFSPVGTAEILKTICDPNLFPELNLMEPIQIEARLVRVKEGIAMEILSLNSVMQVACGRCGKTLHWPVKTTECEEWFYWEKRFEPEESSEELLWVTMKNWSIDVHEPIRQELELARPLAPHCENDCGDWPNLEASEGPEGAETKPFKNLLLQFKQ